MQSNTLPIFSTSAWQNQSSLTSWRLIILLLKTWKPANKGPSYIKILETLLLPAISEYISILLDDINKLDLNDYIKCFLCKYLRGRHTYVVFRNSISKHRKMKQGVPQGGVLSPILFNLYMSSMPAPPGNILWKKYADDSNILKSGPLLKPIVQEINTYLVTLSTWFKGRNLEISPSKSSATLFITASNAYSTVLAVEIDGKKFLLWKNLNF